MTASLYDMSVPGLVGSLKTLSALLDKAAATAEAKKIDPQVFLTARLAPDMAPLTRQVQIASDTAKGAGARLAGVEAPSMPDTETTFPELKARLAATVAWLESLDRAAFDGPADRIITMKMGPTNEASFPATVFLTGFVLPNFYFHMTTAYGILRHNGVEIGKLNYLAALAPYIKPVAVAA